MGDTVAEGDVVMIIARAGKVYADGKRIDVRIRWCDPDGHSNGYHQMTVPRGAVKRTPAEGADDLLIPA